MLAQMLVVAAVTSYLGETRPLAIEAVGVGPVAIDARGKDGTLVIRGRDGTRVRAGEGCEQISASVMHCPQQTVHVRLGPGDDRLAIYGVGGRVDAGDGDDDVLLGAGALEVDGGAGRDTLRGVGDSQSFAGGLGADVIDGGPGRDRIDYSRHGGAVRVDLRTGRGAGGDRLSGIEDVTGGRGVNELRGNRRANRLVGSSASDRLWSGGGDDVLIGRGGRDDLRAGAGDDRVDAGRRDRPIACGAGYDVVAGDGVRVRACEAITRYVDDPNFVVDFPERGRTGIRCFSEFVRECRGRLTFRSGHRRASVAFRARIGRHVRLPLVLRSRLRRLRVVADVRMVRYRRVGVDIGGPLAVTVVRLP